MKLELGHYTFSNCYVQGVPRKKQYHYSFLGEPKISRISDFYRSTLGEWWEIKIIMKSGLYTLWNCYIRDVHERCNNTAPFAEHLKFQAKNDFYRRVLYLRNIIQALKICCSRNQICATNNPLKIVRPCNSTTAPIFTQSRGGKRTCLVDSFIMLG